MSGKKKEKKKRGFFGVLFGVLFWLIVTVVLAAGSLTGYIWNSMRTDPVVTMMPEEWRESEPDSSFRHLSFSSDGRMTQSYDEGDAAYFCAGYMEFEHIDPRSYVEDLPGVELTGIKVELKEGRASMCAEGTLKGIRLIARVIFNTEFRDGTVILTPSELRIANIAVPVSLIDRFFKTEIESSVFEYDLDNVLLSNIEKFEIGDGCVSVTGPMSTEILEGTELGTDRIRIMRLSQKSVPYIGELLDSKETDPAVRYATLLEKITEDPDEYLSFLDQLFSVRSAAFINRLGLHTKNYGLGLRWMTDFEQMKYVNVRNELYDEYYVIYRFLKTISGRLSSAYGSGRISAGNISYKEFFGSDYKFYGPFLDLDNAKGCVCRTSYGSYFGILLRGADGFGYVIACEGDDFRILPLKESVFEDLMSSGSTPEIQLNNQELFSAAV